MNELYAVWDKDSNTISGEYSIEELIANSENLPKNREFLTSYFKEGENYKKYLRDDNGVLVKEFDVLQLEITEELMATSFCSSNLAKDIVEKGNVKSVIITLSDKDWYYSIYYVRNNGYINRNPEGIGPYDEAVGKRDDFIFYFVQKGALVVSNLKTNPDYIMEMLQPLSQVKNATDFGDLIVLTRRDIARVFNKETGERVANLLCGACGDFEAWCVGDSFPFLHKENAIPVNSESEDGSSYTFLQMDEKDRNVLFEEALAEIRKRLRK